MGCKFYKKISLVLDKQRQRLKRINKENCPFLACLEISLKAYIPLICNFRISLHRTATGLLRACMLNVLLPSPGHHIILHFVWQTSN